MNNIFSASLTHPSPIYIYQLAEFILECGELAD